MAGPLGPTPTELFVASLAACVAFYARRFLARHGLDATGLRVEAAYTMSPDRPARVHTITLRLLLPQPLEENRRGAAGGRRPLHRPQLLRTRPRCASRWPSPLDAHPAPPATAGL